MGLVLFQPTVRLHLQGTKIERKRDNQILAWAVIATQFGPPFMFSGVAVALPAMGTDLQAGATSLGLVETLFLAGSVSFLLPVGRLANAGDKKTLYKLGLLSFGVTSLLIGILSSMPLILFIRFLQGISSAIYAGTGPAVLADIVAVENRGKAYGSSKGMVYAGLTLGPILGGILIDFRGWRAVFLAGAAAMLFGYLVIRLMMRSSWNLPISAVHLPSAGLLLASMMLLVAGSTTAGLGWVGPVFLLSSLVLGLLFVWWQRHLEHPLLDIEALMRNHLLRNALFVQFLLYLSTFPAVFLLSIYMQITLGHSAKISGQVIAIGAVLMAVMAPVAGYLTDRYRPRFISSFGVLWILVSALMAVFLDQTTSLFFVAVLLAIQGVGLAFFSPPNMTSIMNSVPAEKISIASALGAKSRSLGMVSGMVVTAILISLNLGNDPLEQHPIAFMETMVTTFLILAVLTAVALVVCFQTRTRR